MCAITAHISKIKGHNTKLKFRYYNYYYPCARHAGKQALLLRRLSVGVRVSVRAKTEKKLPIQN